MTYSYTPPSDGVFADPKDEVRLLARDTTRTGTSVEDEDIAYYLAQRQGEVRLAAADILEVRASVAEANTRKTIAVGPFSTSLALGTEAAEAYRALAASLRSGELSGGAVLTADLDPDQYAPVFELGMMTGYGYGVPRQLEV